MSAIEPEETVDSETVFDGRLIDVRRVTVRLKGGKTTQREIVDHPDAVAVLPVRDNGDIIFVRQYRKAAERVLLELPAGGVDEGESPEETVRREMIEETGYRVGSVQRLAGFFTSPGFTTEYMHLYLATDLEAGEPTEEGDEIELVELSLDEAIRRLDAGEIEDGKSIAGLLFYARRQRQG